MKKVAAFLVALALVCCKNEKTFAPAEPGWEEVHTWGADEETYSFTADGINLIVSTSEGLYRSSDNGMGWEKIQNPFEDQSSEGPGVLFLSDIRVFAAGRNGGLSTSANLGNAWEKLDAFLPEFGT